MKKLIILFISVATLFTFNNCQFFDESNLPKTVDFVDVEKYTGVWYEISSIPQPFSVGCLCTTAEYQIISSDKISVFNRCILNRPTGPENTILGEAKVVPNSGNAKLSVSFSSVGNFGAPYWIVDLADDYSYAVVSDPLKATLWVLSRTPKMDDALYSAIIKDLKARKFPVARLKKTRQDC